MAFKTYNSLFMELLREIDATTISQEELDAHLNSIQTTTILVIWIF